MSTCNKTIGRKLSGLRLESNVSQATVWSAVIIPSVNTEDPGCWWIWILTYKRKEHLRKINFFVVKNDSLSFLTFYFGPISFLEFKICLWYAIMMKNTYVFWRFWLKVMVPSIFIVLCTLQNTFTYIISSFMIALHGSQELVAYSHLQQRRLKMWEVKWLVSGHKANACVAFVLLNQYISKVWLQNPEILNRKTESRQLLPNNEI